MPVGIRKLGPATLRVAMNELVSLANRNKLRELVDVRVEEGQRGAGHGTRLLRKVCAEADTARKLLLVHVETENARLMSWYAQHGFEMLQMEPEFIMVRPPAQ